MTIDEEIQDAIEWIEGLRNGWNDKDNIKYCNMAIKALEGADLDGFSSRLWKAAYERGKAEVEQRWIPVKWHEITEEEREKEGYPNEWLVHLDCILPEDGEEILITTKHGYVEKDTAYCDDGYYLDSGCDWVDDVVAWMPLPEPYRAESEEV